MHSTPYSVLCPFVLKGQKDILQLIGKDHASDDDDKEVWKVLLSDGASHQSDDACR